MAIAFDTDGGGFTNSSSGSLTYTHTCTGSNLVLYVLAGTASGVTVTGITYNSVAMSLVDSYTGIGQAVDNLYLYILTAPATGSNSVVVSASGSGSLIYSQSGSYTGAAQSGQPPHTAKNTGNSVTTLTTTVNTSTAPSTDNCWIVGGYSLDGNFTVSAGAGTTLRSTNASIKNWLGIMDGNAVVHPAGSSSLIFNSSSSCNMRGIITSLAPFVAPSGPTNVKTWDGVTQSTGIKTYEGVAVASVKSVNGIT